MTRIGRVLLVLAAANFPGFGTTVYYIETGQTGAALDIDVISSDTWMFTPSYSWDLGGGIFTMKKGSATAASITLTLNDVTNNISSLTSVTLDPSSFTSELRAGNVRLQPPLHAHRGCAVFARFKLARE
jgi:hypothetical protein